MLEGCSTTAGYQALEGGFDNSFTDMYGAGSTIQPYSERMFTGGGALKKNKTKQSKTKKGKTKQSKTKQSKTKKRQKVSSIRKPVSNKIKSLAKMRMDSVKSVEQRQKKLSKRLKQRKMRSKVIDSLSTNVPLTNDLLQTLTPSMQKFISKIPKNNSRNSRIIPFSKISDQYGGTPKESKKTKKKKPQYAPKSKSLIKFSDFRSIPSKEKSKKRAMKRRKGDTR